MVGAMVSPATENPVHSIVVRMEALDGTKVAESAAGVARPDSSEAMLPSHRAHIASVAKTFTAVLVMQLAEEGVLGEDGIDMPYAEFGVLPQDIVRRLHRMDGVSHGEKITPRQLLTHTSGIRDAMVDDARQCGGPAPGSLIGSLLAPGGNPGRSWIAWNPQREDDAASGVINFFIHSGISDAPLSLPGERFHYSDTGFVLLGMLVESVTGMPLHKALRSRIFGPLGLADTYLAYREDPSLGPARQPEAEVYAGQTPLLTTGVNLSFDWAGGGLVATMADLAAFMRGLASGQLFSDARTWTEMTRWIRPDGLEGLRTGVGLGLFRTSCAGIDLWGHSGAWGTKMEFDPESGLIFVGTTNQVFMPNDWHHRFVEKGIRFLTQSAPHRSNPLLHEEIEE